MMSLVSKIANRSPTLDSGARDSLGTLKKQSSSSDRTGIGKSVAETIEQVKLSRAKVHVYSASVLCLGKIHGHPTSTRKERRIDGESSSSGIIFSQDTQYWNCSMRLKRRWQKTESNLRNSRKSNHLYVGVQRHRLDERHYKKYISIF